MLDASTTPLEDQTSKCECSSPGYCELLKREMGTARFNECKNLVPHYFEMFLKEANDGSYERNKAKARDPNNRPDTTIDQLNALATNPKTIRNVVSNPCTHLGEVLETRSCPSCSGTVNIKIYECAMHKECTLGKQVEATACCVRCSDYEAASTDIKDPDTDISTSSSEISPPPST